MDLKKNVFCILLVIAFTLSCKKKTKDNDDFLALLLFLQANNRCNNAVSCTLSDISTNMKAGGISSSGINRTYDFSKSLSPKAALTNLPINSCYNLASSSSQTYYTYQVFTTNCYPGTTEPAYTNWLAYGLVYDSSSSLAPDQKIPAPDGQTVRAEGLDFTLNFVTVGFNELNSGFSTSSPISNQFYQKGETKSFTFNGKPRIRNSYIGVQGNLVHSFSVTTGYENDLNKHMITRVTMDMANKTVSLEYRGSTTNSLTQGAYRVNLANMEYSDSTVTSITGQEALDRNIYLKVGSNSSFTVLDSISQRRLFKAEGKWYQKFNARMITALSYGNQATDLCFDYGTGPSTFDIKNSFCSDLSSPVLATASVSGFAAFELGNVALTEPTRSELLEYYKTRKIDWTSVDDLTTENFHTFGKN